MHYSSQPPLMKGVRSKGVFVTGTDTEIGKTFVSFLVAGAFLERGINAAVIKPFATGGVKAGGEITSTDALFLKKRLGLEYTLRELNPVCLKSPLSPYAAAKIEKIKLSPQKALKAIAAFKKKCEFLVVEGIGGAAVPIKIDYSVADLIKDAGFPALIVARPALGAVNHTALTVNELRRRGVAIAGIVINYSEGSKKGLAERTNPKIIEDVTGIPVLCEIPHIVNTCGKTAARVRKTLFEKLHRQS